MSEFRLSNSIPPQHVRRAAELFFEAFYGKIGPLLGDRQRGVDFVADVLDPDYAICALSADHRDLYGIAGFKTADGALVGGTYADMRRHYGAIGGLWRGLALSVLEREVEPGRLLMDGIAVDPQKRGLGVGSALLDAVVAHARKLTLDEVRLDVIDSNPGARALYERRGFVASEVHELGSLSRIFGFQNATTMVKSVM